MAKQKAAGSSAPEANGSNGVLRRHAEQEFAEELAALRAADNRPKPPNWALSPWAVKLYLVGGKLDKALCEIDISSRKRRTDFAFRDVTAESAVKRLIADFDRIGFGKTRARRHTAANK